MSQPVRVLLVEDDTFLLAAVRAALESAGCAVTPAGDIAGAAAAVAATRFDCVVLDRLLPDGDAITYVRDGRRVGWDVPVLFLTGLDGVADRVAGFHHGGDDYLTKPFSVAELVARVRALCVRAGAGRPAVLRFADIELDSVRREIRRGGVLLTLSGKEFAVLEYLMCRPEQAVSRAELIEHCWDEQTDPMSNVVDVVIRRLRVKLREPNLVRTLRGAGYGLISPAAG